VPEMAQSSWMAKKFTRGMTYQWKAKDWANAREDLFGVANISLLIFLTIPSNIVPQHKCPTLMFFN